MLIRALGYCITVCAASSLANLAAAQAPQPTAAERAAAAQINCEDFQKNSDGSWTSSPTATVGTVQIGSGTFGIRQINIGGVDLAVVLNQKCPDQTK